MRIGYFTVFVWPLIALFAFVRGGAWAWAFVPVMVGLGGAELVSLWWRRRSLGDTPRGRAPAAARPRSPRP